MMPLKRKKYTQNGDLFYFLRFFFTVELSHFLITNCWKICHKKVTKFFSKINKNWSQFWVYFFPFGWAELKNKNLWSSFGTTWRRKGRKESIYLFFYFSYTKFSFLHFSRLDIIFTNTNQFKNTTKFWFPKFSLTFSFYIDRYF